MSIFNCLTEPEAVWVGWQASELGGISIPFSSDSGISHDPGISHDSGISHKPLCLALYVVLRNLGAYSCNDLLKV